VFGDPESGKTWLCIASLVEALLAGRSGLIVDLDHNGPDATVGRMLALGAPESALRDPDRFRYCEPEDRAEVRQVIDDAMVWRPAVAIVDSVGELLPLYGANSNSADDFTTTHSYVLKPLIDGVEVPSPGYAIWETRPRSPSCVETQGPLVVAPLRI
jgi:hypothetical protein